MTTIFDEKSICGRKRSRRALMHHATFTCCRVALHFALYIALHAALFTGLAVPAVDADELIPTTPSLRWWKGNLHTHSLWSDGNDFPEMISEWYRTHGYNFLAISDHNVMAEGQRWMSVAAIEARASDDALTKYQARFGQHWVELREASKDAPETDFATTKPTRPPNEVRLKPLNEYRALLEERGRFILMTGEEVSDTVQGKPLHINVTNLKVVMQPLGGESIAAAMRANLRAAIDQSERRGREVLVHLNHPNFHYAITAADIAEVLEERFFEVYNGHPDVHHLGDEQHPSTERIWDIANTIRLTRFPEALPLLGIATDDSHNYHSDEGSTPGRGWVMTRAYHLTPESILRAMHAGDFFASSGVLLREIRFRPDSNELLVEVEAEPDTRYQIDFIGTRSPSDDQVHEPEINADQIGVVLASHKAVTHAVYRMRGDELYVRAVIRSDRPHPNPSFANQTMSAWTQPVVPSR